MLTIVLSISFEDSELNEATVVRIFRTTVADV